MLKHGWETIHEIPVLLQLFLLPVATSTSSRGEIELELKNPEPSVCSLLASPPNSQRPNECEARRVLPFGRKEGTAGLG